MFCAVEPVSTFVRSDIAFPNQIEMRVNGTGVGSNLRGLKNRPGSTRPADITDLLRKTQNYENSLTVGYALTHKVRVSIHQSKSVLIVATEILFCGESCEAGSGGEAC